MTWKRPIIYNIYYYGVNQTVAGFICVLSDFIASVDQMRVFVHVRTLIVLAWESKIKS